VVYQQEASKEGRPYQLLPEDVYLAPDVQGLEQGDLQKVQSGACPPAARELAMIHYLKQKYKNVKGSISFLAWCGEDDDVPQRDLSNPIPRKFTYNISNVNCEDCKEAAALEELSKIP